MAVGCCVAVAPLPKTTAELEHKPAWVAYVVAAIFFLAGVGILADAKGRAGALIGAIVCAGLAILGFWVAFGFAPEPMEGGLPLIPSTWNQTIGRVAFGFGALCTAAFALWGLHRVLKPRKTK